MTDEMKLLMALCDALGFDVERDREQIGTERVEGPVNPRAGIRVFHERPHMVTKLKLTPKP